MRHAYDLMALRFPAAAVDTDIGMQMLLGAVKACDPVEALRVSQEHLAGRPDPELLFQSVARLSDYRHLAAVTATAAESVSDKPDGRALVEQQLFSACARIAKNEVLQRKMPYAVVPVPRFDGVVPSMVTASAGSKVPIKSAWGRQITAAREALRERSTKPGKERSALFRKIPLQGHRELRQIRERVQRIDEHQLDLKDEIIPAGVLEPDNPTWSARSSAAAAGSLMAFGGRTTRLAVVMRVGADGGRHKLHSMCLQRSLATGLFTLGTGTTFFTVEEAIIHFSSNLAAGKYFLLS